MNGHCNNTKWFAEEQQYSMEWFFPLLYSIQSSFVQLAKYWTTTNGTPMKKNSANRLLCICRTPSTLLPLSIAIMVTYCVRQHQINLKTIFAIESWTNNTSARLKSSGKSSGQILWCSFVSSWVDFHICTEGFVSGGGGRRTGVSAYPRQICWCKVQIT